MRRFDLPDLDSLCANEIAQVSQICDDYADAWRGAARPRIADHLTGLGGCGDPTAKLVLLRELLVRREELLAGDGHENGLDAALAALGAADRAAVFQSVLLESARLGASRRFRDLKEYKAGGMGRVYLATDTQLGREVAVKQMKVECSTDRELRSRFIQEAEITGRLEHPGIPPVYVVGFDGDGNPFYAMRKIAGESLELAIQRVHEAESGVDWTRSSAVLRDLLGRFRAVCQTVDFAHSRGFIHRDLKPANVVLGSHSETYVIDWGLAKYIGLDDRDPDAKFTAGLDDGQTTAGTVVGTWSHMSPEQADPALGAASTASDVYCLGATLYHVLTGRPPFIAHDQEELHGRVAKADFPPPSKLNPAVPVQLDAIVRRAMAREPARRYQSAREIADDIDRWLADEPVLAAPDSWPASIHRKLRKRPALTWAAAVGLFVAMLGFAAVAAIKTEDNRVLRSSRLAESNARQSATRRFEVALAAIGDYERQLRDDAVLKNDELKGLRGKLLTRAVELFKQLAAQLESEVDPGPDNLSALAEAEIRIGSLTGEIGDVRGAIELLSRAAARLVELTRSHPEVASHRAALAQAYHNLGLVRVVAGRTTEAGAALKQSLALNQALGREHPEEPTYLSKQVRTYNSLGLLFSSIKPEEAEAEYERGVDVGERLVSDHPGVIAYRYELLTCEGSLAKWLYDHGRTVMALPRLKHYVQGLEELVKQAKDEPRYRNDLASGYRRLAFALTEFSEVESARTTYQNAISLQEALVRENPAIGRFREDLAKTFSDFGVFMKKRFDDLVAAETAYRRATEEYDVLRRDHSNSPYYRRGQGVARLNLSIILRESGRYAEALRERREVVGEFESLVREIPEDLTIRRNLGVALDNLGESQVDLKRYPEAADSFRQAIEHLGYAHARARSDSLTVQFMSHVYCHAGEVELKLKHPVEAARAALDCQATFSSGPELLFRAASVLAGCIELVGGENGVPSPRLRRQQDEYADEAVFALRRAIGSGYKDGEQIAKAAALDCLRSREDFKALLADLAFPADPFAR
jgi:serine/threonine-protein kinase